MVHPSEKRVAPKKAVWGGAFRTCFAEARLASLGGAPLILLGRHSSARLSEETEEMEEMVVPKRCPAQNKRNCAPSTLR